MTPDPVSRRPSVPLSPPRAALRVALVYFLLAGLWIVLSDRVLELIVTDVDRRAIAQSFKGLFFVTITGVGLYLYVFGRTATQLVASRALRDSEEQLRGAFEFVTVGMAQASLADGRLLRVNRTMCEITGYTEDELLTMRFSDFTHPDDRDDDFERFQRMTRGEAVNYETEKRFVRKDGNVIWVNVNATVVRDPDGAPDRSVAVIQEITAQKLAQEALRQSEARFREMADALPQMIYTAEADGTVDYVNRRWIEYVGMDVAEANDGGWQRVIHPDDFSAVYATWANGVQRGVPYETEYRLRHASGAGEYRWQLARAVPTRDAEGRVVKWFGTVTDIDDRKRATDQVRQLNETLEQRVRDRTASLQAANEELDAFSYTVSHDLRAPLQNLQSVARALLDGSTADRPVEEREEGLRRIVAMSARMERLILDLLEYSRVARSDLKPVPVSTVTIVHEIVSHLERDPTTARALVTFREPLPWVLGNRLILQQVFANLIANAVKFVKPGQAPRVNIWSEDVGPNARIWIEDRGIGVARADFDRIFQPFETVNPSEVYTGSGIGLAIVKRAVERMGGHVGLESTEGQGSRFWIELPKVYVAP